MSSIWYHTLFKLRIYENDGNPFQALFNNVASRQYGDDFQPVRPWGKSGDRGNDGFLKSEGHYFQLYAPESNPSAKVKEAVNKAFHDFNKLKSRYENLKKYTFVFNDKFKGIPEPIHKTLQEIEAKFKVDARAQGAHWLLNIFMNLDAQSKESILNTVPPDYTVRVSPSILRETLDFIIKDIDILKPPSQCNLPPGFNRKVKFNKLGQYFADLLKQFYTQTPILQKLIKESPALNIILPKVLDNTYTALKKRYEGIEDKADIIFVSMVENLKPRVESSTIHAKIIEHGYKEAVLVVMAQYFEPCAFYEDPN